MEISKELKEQAKACKTAEELMALAKANGIELSEDEITLLLESNTEGQLADNELENVAGGTDGCGGPGPHEMKYWDRFEEVEFLFKAGDIVEALTGSHNRTISCEVMKTRVEEDGNSSKWYDQYYLRKTHTSNLFSNGWYSRRNIEK